jgi:predicted NBD/HSP70 family sugar kinase
MKPPSQVAAKVLVIDVGGSHVKFLASGHRSRRKFASGPKLTPALTVERVRAMTTDWDFEVIALAYPGVVEHGKPTQEPYHLGKGWVGFDFDTAFGRPVRIANDAAMQALGGYRGKTMLFLGLGTGLGSALIADDVIVPMELGHLHCRRGRTYEDFLGKQGYGRLGKKKWRRKVWTIVAAFRAALLPDDIVIGGGQAARLRRLPPLARRADNAATFLGGVRLWGTPTPAVGTLPEACLASDGNVDRQKAFLGNRQIFHHKYE